MKTLLTDPIVLVTAAVFVGSLIALVWGLKKLKSSSQMSIDTGPLDGLLPASNPMPEINLNTPPISFTSVPPPIGTAPVSKDVADRLESMSQRLLDMQAVLSKQPAAAPGTPAAQGGLGQGFSPETIEKLLKIIGNVIQQVDTLQKSLNIPK